jgi:gamma-glutamylcyclotransferase (GGCT)/AIG2-like uncharacterized protein YtfP
MSLETHDALIFVYGTLRRRSGHASSVLLAASASFVDEASFQGKLYQVAEYPGAVASADTEDRVIGEVYRLHETESTLHRLDLYEGCSGDDDTDEYVRKRVKVELRRGGQAAAWTYLYNRSTQGLPRIASGNFVTRGEDH